MTKLEQIARNYAETKEQATKREWSAYGDIREESHLDASQAMLSLFEEWIEGTKTNDCIECDVHSGCEKSKASRKNIRQELRRKIEEWRR
jgi:hypothetical protein